MSKALRSDFATYHTATPRFELAKNLADLFKTVAAWFSRPRQRRALAELDQHLLDDVGLTREIARHEAAKPFWKR